MRILLVEDDPDLIALSNRALSGAPNAKIFVEHVNSGVEATQRLAQEPFDVLLLGLGPFESQGLSTLATIRRQPEQYTGQTLARLGLLCSLIFLVGGVSYD